MPEQGCTHIGAIGTVKHAKRYECEECVKIGSTWVHLRTCQECGTTRCCDNSPNRHATKHARASGHPVIASAEPGERWLYCYPDDEFAEYLETALDDSSPRLYNSYMNRTGKASAPPVEFLSLLHTAYAAQAEIESQLSVVGLSLPKLLALKALSDAGDSLPLGQLAERLSCVKSNITQLVDRLEADGFVARQPDPGDRRTRLAVLTAAGRKACQDGSRIQQDAERKLLTTLTRDEARQLGMLLGKIGKSSG